ncbi:glycosyltransferase [Alsobacter sp. KACC 23698]|uniref:Glycosyltransferase n=1 Tax=Alsobacter sp. KACC 23698 TaxID=3149229 RepID=A0AAU7JJK2_9HYPH
MKIAIVTPHPSPFALGGAENLWWGLQTYFEEHTPHRCDVVALLGSEQSFWDLIASYRAFAQLDLSGYDCVISGKYPAWMVKHPRHICYMLHRLRGLYDTYAQATSDPAVFALGPVRELLDWMDDVEAYGGAAEDDEIEEAFARFERLRSAGLPDAAFAFPGPLIRRIIHFLDAGGLSPRRISRYAAISETVRRRPSYFPDGVTPDVLRPPPHRDDHHEGDFRYFFTSSRLDRPKRVDLIIEAMRDVKQDVPLLIAGTGPDGPRLQELAAPDKRIRFLGYVPDADMAELYANALAVPFAPYDEDYGLVTLEAMRSGKPVLTTVDAGGPTEFVRHEHSGLLSPATPKAFGEALSRVAGDPDLARRMGAAARRDVEGVGWEAVAAGLLRADAAPQVRRAHRPKLTAAVTFRVFPPMNGGQARVYHLYKNLAEVFDIDLVCLTGSTELRSEKEIAPGLLEICVPRSHAHAAAERDIFDLADQIPIGDIAAYALTGLSSDYEEALELSAMTSDAVIACHPYLVASIRKVAPDRPLWYEAQDVEITLKTALFQDCPAAARLLEEVRDAERSCWTAATTVFACAERDLDELASLYGPTRARRLEVPNGVALDEIQFTSLARRREVQRRASLGPMRTALFMGSWHGPNLAAVEDIIREAPLAPDTRFVVVGSACLPFKERKLPENVHLLGPVDQSIRDDLLAAADVALNPMRFGSGTNLKMLDYFAAGIPVISTAFGARGLAVAPGVHYIVAPDDGLAQALGVLATYDDASLAAMVDAARAVVEDLYSWKQIARRFADAVLHAGFDAAPAAPD